MDYGMWRVSGNITHPQATSLQSLVQKITFCPQNSLFWTDLFTVRLNRTVSCLMLHLRQLIAHSCWFLQYFDRMSLFVEFGCHVAAIVRCRSIFIKAWPYTVVTQQLFGGATSIGCLWLKSQELFVGPKIWHRSTGGDLLHREQTQRPSAQDHATNNIVVFLYCLFSHRRKGMTWYMSLWK